MSETKLHRDQREIPSEEQKSRALPLDCGNLGCVCLTWQIIGPNCLLAFDGSVLPSIRSVWKKVDRTIQSWVFNQKYIWKGNLIWVGARLDSRSFLPEKNSLTTLKKLGNTIGSAAKGMSWKTTTHRKFQIEEQIVQILDEFLGDTGGE